MTWRALSATPYLSSGDAAVPSQTIARAEAEGAAMRVPDAPAPPSLNTRARLLSRHVLVFRQNMLMRVKDITKCELVIP